MQENQNIFLCQYDNLNSTQRNQILYLVFRQEENLKSLYLGSVERSLKTLFLLNAGGVVTVLAYIKKTNYCAKTLLYITLIIFLLGLLSALLVTFLDFKNSYDSYMQYQNNLKEYFSNKIVYQKVNEFTGTDIRHIIRIGYFSALCIPAGLLFGLIGYFLT
ncbi:hypothetical protein [Legionella cherrii]|uniref:Transmembrane protein n=1 Tax=Legionella cherrii TaxID=28084 RepID=A0ABY6T5E8_9GAMM|nr:hypothetical protein [Legionella cherrii]VEB35519.1 Uncharacterised protein [Legionella cherrii]